MKSASRAQTTQPFCCSSAGCFVASGQRLNLKNDCGRQSNLISQPAVSERDGFLSQTPGPGLSAQTECQQSGR